MIMFPNASIHCVQLSLVNNLDPQTRIEIGKALSELRKENVLIIGSGFSFHNLKAIFSEAADVPDSKNEAFEHWLVDTCTNDSISTNEQETRLIEWSQAPFARYCHPREEHLLPLHVCFGFSNTVARVVFNDKILGKKPVGFNGSLLHAGLATFDEKCSLDQPVCRVQYYFRSLFHQRGGPHRRLRAPRAGALAALFARPLYAAGRLQWIVPGERLSLSARGKVRYELKTPYRDGTTHVIFEPVDFIARLAALVPKPRVNLTRYHEVFAANNRLR
jgi:hypothetical protein